jgi:Ca-activated chloride channel family protein
MPDFDDWIDHQLRNVPVPPDLVWRLSEIRPEQHDAKAEALADARLDLVLRQVPIPSTLVPGLMRIARRRGPSPLVVQMALAASVLIMLGLGTAGYLSIIDSKTGNKSPKSALATNVSAKKPAAKNPTLSNPAVASPKMLAKKTPLTRPSTARRQRDAVSSSQSPNIAANPDIAAKKIQPVASLAHEPTERSLDAPQSQDAALPYSLQDVAAAGSSLWQALETRLRSQATLGAAGVIERLPKLDSFESPASAGVAPPRVRGYDLLFHLKYGEHPFAPPAAHAELASSKMPFTFRTASYDLAVDNAQAGQLPPAEEIRPEDFLAAQDYALPPAPENGLALHVAATPSPFAEAGLHLLQLAVKAGGKHSAGRRPARLVAAVDTSSRMAGGARWATTVRALEKIAADMGPQDRLTLIGYAEQPRILADDATAVQLRAIVSTGLPQPAGSADLAAAIHLACDVAGKAPSMTSRIVIVTATSGDAGEATMARIDESLGRLAAMGVPWQLVRLAAPDPESPLAALAGRHDVEIVAAESADQVYAALWQKLTGQSSIVAHAVSLKLTLNPRVVTGYRLLGHASATLTAENTAPLEISLHANQTATAMYELWIKPGATAPVATAELTWRDPASSEQRRLIQSLGNEQIAASFSEAPAWFQHGVIAAKTAEALRGSYFVSGARPLDQIRDLAAQVDRGTAEQPNFQALLRLLEQTQKLR